MSKLLCVNVFLFLLFLNSCSSDHEPAENKTASLKSEEVLQGGRLNLSENLYQIRDIGLIKIEDTYFALVTDASNAPPIHLLNVSEDTYIDGLGAAGQGPGEFVQPFSVSFFDEMFIINDPRSTRLTHIPKDVFLNPEMRDHRKFHIDNIRFSGLPLNVHPIDSDNYVVVGPIRTSENHRFSLVNPEEETNKFFGSHDSFDSNIDPSTNQLSNREYGTFSNEKSMFATGKYHKDQIDIFDYEGNLISSYKGPDYGEINYKIDGNQYVLNDENIIGYVDITSNSDYIYALYSGKNLNQEHRNFGDTIIVIDWDGNFIDSFKLDQQIYSIAVNDENSLLLAGVQTDNAGLYEYRINE